MFNRMKVGVGVIKKVAKLRWRWRDSIKSSTPKLFVHANVCDDSLFKSLAEFWESLCGHCDIVFDALRNPNAFVVESDSADRNFIHQRRGSNAAVGWLKLSGLVRTPCLTR